MSGNPGRGGVGNGYRPPPRSVTRLNQPPGSRQQAMNGSRGGGRGRPAANGNDPMMKKPVFNGGANRGQTVPTPTVRLQPIFQSY